MSPIAPELREALNRGLHDIRRCLQLMALCPDPAPELDELADAVAEIDALINGAADRIDAEAAVTELDRLVDDVARRFRLAGLAGQGQIAVTPGAGARVTGISAAKTRRALTNLVSNALEHGGGQVSIRSEAWTDKVALVVENDGRPAPIGDRQAVRPGRGHGLGIVHDLAREAGGEFGFGPKPDGGAIARIELQRAEVESVRR